MANGDPASRPIGTPADSRQRIGFWISLIGFAGFLAGYLVAAWPNTADDAYITLRYARHLADGLGIAWNPAGDPGVLPVEGYSNFLFVLLGAGLMKVGVADPMAWLKALGGAAAFGTLAVSGLIARRRHGLIAALVVIVAVVTHPGMAYWAVSGMETTVCQFLVVVAVWATLAAAQESRPDRAALRLRLGAGLALFGASLARPESPIVLVALVAFVLVATRHRGAPRRVRGTLQVVVPFLALYLPYTAWRVWYFGRWLPNSAACKAGYATDPVYLAREFLGHAWPFLALAIVGVLLEERHERRRDYVLLLGIPVLYLATFYGVDPVMSHLDRHFMVAWPLVALAGVFGLLAMAEKFGSKLEASRRSTATVLLALTAISLGVVTSRWTVAQIEQAVDLAHPLEDVRRELGTYLRDSLRPGESYAIGDTGLVPFLAGGTVLDVYCLNCREATAPPIDRSPERLAHWIVSRRPRYIIVQAISGAAERGAWPTDRALREHPALASEYTRRREVGDADDPLRYLVFERRTLSSSEESSGESL